MLAQQEIEHQHQHQLTMMKGKRTKRSRTASPLPLTMSTSGEESCLVAASSSTTTTTVVESGAHICNTSPITISSVVSEEEEDMANCLIMLAQGAGKIPKLTHIQQQESSPTMTPPSTAAAAYVYECKTCNRCFSSFQALGGHRASHRKPKLSAVETPPPADDHRPHQDYFPTTEAIKINKVEELGLSLQMACNSSNTLSASNNNNNNESNTTTTKPNKVHACAICGSEFSSGQALGGHMRRHRPIATSSGGGSQSAKSGSPPTPARNLLCLDLNLPAADEQEDPPQPPPESAKFIFGSSEKTLVFANSLVDCRY